VKKRTPVDNGNSTTRHPKHPIKIKYAEIVQ